MKLISWNVNGLRACLAKGFTDFVRDENPDILCLQETKMQEGQAEVPVEGYRIFWNSAERKGYSGTAIFTKTEPKAIYYGIGSEVPDREGRAITCEFEQFFLVNVYSPNSQPELVRLPFRLQWEDDLRRYLAGLTEQKPVILCGDMNVAHEEIDLKNPKANRGSAGFSDEERTKMTELLQAGFLDSFRALYPDMQGAYSWWSYRFHARETNAGWRIDYFLLSHALQNTLKDSFILSHVQGSDHCPVGILLHEE